MKSHINICIVTTLQFWTDKSERERFILRQSEGINYGGHEMEGRVLCLHSARQLCIYVHSTGSVVGLSVLVTNVCQPLSADMMHEESKRLVAMARAEEALQGC